MLNRIKIFLTFLILGIGISLFFSHPAQAQGLFIRGDINGDEVVDTVDFRLLITTSDTYCNNRRDVNDDGGYSRLYDSTYLANYLFLGGPPPPHPFPNCGFDTTADGFTCPTSTCCTLATECDDGIDNDGDGYTDLEDCGCADICDTIEGINTAECNDGIDNDGDGLIDLADPHCHKDSCDRAELCPDPSLAGDCCYKPADVNGDYKWTLTDIVALVNMIFKGAPKPNPLCRTDCNSSGGNPNLTDVVCLVGKVFKGGPNPIKIGVCCLD